MSNCPDVPANFASEEDAQAAFRAHAERRYAQVDTLQRIVGAGERGILQATSGPPALLARDAERLEMILSGEFGAVGTEPGAFRGGVKLPFAAEVLEPAMVLARLGPHGAALGTGLFNAYEKASMLKGVAFANLKGWRDKLTSEEAARFSRFRERGEGIATPAMREVNAELDRFLNLWWQRAGEQELKLAERLENYWPHRQKWEPTDEGATEVWKRKAASIQREAHARGIELTLDEASAMLRQRLHDQASVLHRDGHLEYERIEGLDDYVTDFSQALYSYFDHTADRIAFASVFGPSGKRAEVSIGALFNENAEAGAYAEKVWRLAVGNERVRLPTAVRTLYSWGLAKLGLSGLAQAQQTLNVGIAADYRSLLRGIDSVGRDFKGSTQAARKAGAIVYDTLAAIDAEGARALISLEGIPRIQGRLAQVKAAVESAMTVGLSVTDEIARTVAFRSGQGYFDDIAAALASNSGDAAALAALREFRFKPEVVIAALGNETRRNFLRDLMGKRVADASQFRTTPLTTPLLAQSPFGVLAFQFKRFGIQQTRFVINQLRAYERGDTARSLRALSSLLVAFPASSLAVLLAKEQLVGRTLRSDDLHKAMQQEGFAAQLGLYSSLFANGAGLGILGDSLSALGTGNPIQRQLILNAPALSSLSNAATILWHAGQTGKALAADRPVEARRAGERTAFAAAREFGALGRGLLRPALGEPGLGR